MRGKTYALAALLSIYPLSTSNIGGNYTNTAKDTRDISIEIWHDGPKKFYTDELKGLYIEGTYQSFLGIDKGILPDTIEVDFRKQIEDMWSRKMYLARRKKVEKNKITYFYENTVKTFLNKPFTKMTVEEYLEEIAQSKKEVSQLNWKTVGTLTGMDSLKTYFVRSVFERIKPSDILAYGMTELFPLAGIKNPAETNLYGLEFLLENAGAEFVRDLIPSLGDKILSFGNYQFTEYALKDDGKSAIKASLINLALPDSLKITGDLKHLRGRDHHKAAYLLAIYNISELTRVLNSKQFQLLQKEWTDRENIVKFIAPAHHGEVRTIYFMKKWLNDRAKKDFEAYCSRRYQGYINRTISNWDVIDKYATSMEIRDIEKFLEKDIVIKKIM